MGRDLMTGVRAHCVNGVRESIVIACVWCEIEGLMGVVSANDRVWGQHTNIVVVIAFAFIIVVSCEMEGLMGVASSNNGGWSRCDRRWCCDCRHGCKRATGVGAGAIAGGAVTAGMAVSVQRG